MTSFQEIILLMLLIAVFSLTGLWPHIVRGLRQLRGESAAGGNEVSATTPPHLEVCYKMLGVAPSASWEEIERAYREKAKIHHPDRGGDADAMRALNDAYALLKRLRRQL